MIFGIDIILFYQIGIIFNIIALILGLIFGIMMVVIHTKPHDLIELSKIDRISNKYSFLTMFIPYYFVYSLIIMFIVTYTMRKYDGVEYIKQMIIEEKKYKL